MIRKDELRTYANQKGLNLGQAEKNYLHILTLHAVSRLFPDSLVFKGGTALMICHNLDRFSEDLDFTLTQPEDELLEQIHGFLKQQGVALEAERTQKTSISESYLLRYQGPLYTGPRQTTSKIELDLSLREDVERQTENRRVIHPYPDTPTFHLQTMALQEMLAEKIRAVLTRNKARDMYDAEYLLAKNVAADKELIDKKLAYYNTVLEREDIETALENKRKLWNAELSNLVETVPDFDTTKQRILEALK